MELVSYNNNNNKWYEGGRKSDFCIFQILVMNRIGKSHSLGVSPSKKSLNIIQPELLKRGACKRDKALELRGSPV
jgi:hypothetical protein